MSLTTRQHLAFELFKCKDITIEKAYKLADEFLAFNHNQEEKATSPVPEKKESVEDDYSDCNEIFAKHIDYLEFTARTRRIIMEQGFRLIGDLVQSSPIELLKKQGFGQKSYDEVHDVLNYWGLDFDIDRKQMKTYNPDTDGKDCKIKHFRNWRTIYFKKYQKALSDNEKLRYQNEIDKIDRKLQELDS